MNCTNPIQSSCKNMIMAFQTFPGQNYLFFQTFQGISFIFTWTKTVQNWLLNAEISYTMYSSILNTEWDSTMIILQAFQGLENFYIKFQAFPYLSRICTNPANISIHHYKCVALCEVNSIPCTSKQVRSSVIRQMEQSPKGSHPIPQWRKFKN